jgi:mannose-6-phosphate isomerase-like protein (cupin superfamily)
VENNAVQQFAIDFATGLATEATNGLTPEIITNAERSYPMERRSPGTTSLDVLAPTFETTRVSDAAEELAPDGSRVRPLISLAPGGMAQFELEAGQISKAVMHRSVEEIWLVLSGRGQIWRQNAAKESIVDLEAGVCVSIPVHTAFQFRCSGAKSLRIAAVTMPPWPGGDEAVQVAGKWN